MPRTSSSVSDSPRRCVEANGNRRGAAGVRRSHSAPCRPFIRRDQPVAPPSHGRQPGARGHDGSIRRIRSRPAPPPSEPGRRRAGIQAALSTAMLPDIHQHVDQGMADGARAGERPGMVAGAPDAPAAAQRPIHRAGEAYRETLDAARQATGVLRFDDQMHVICLHRELDDAKIVVGRARKRGPDGREDPAGAETAERGHRPQGDVHGMRRAVRGSRGVPDDAAAGSALPTCTGPAPSPGAADRERQLQCARHLDSALIAY
jgi:hypothetical protein